MDKGKLYFIKDEFYDRFQGCGLSKNKNIADGKKHNRPCCYLFEFAGENADIYWMVPISSKTQKYEEIYNKSIKKYGKCDSISFGYILGEKRAFLVQNLFPVTENYVENIYIDKNTSLPITLSADLMAEINKKARKKIRYNLEGKQFGFSDVKKIYDELIKDKK